VEAVLADLMQRFLTALPQEQEGLLQAGPVQSADTAGGLQAPWLTTLISGIHNGTHTPLAVVLMTIPTLAPDDPALLEFVARRSQANKAPFFVTWTMRDADLWETPKPGSPLSRESLKKLRQYPPLFEIGPAGLDLLTEPDKLKILETGGGIVRDLARLLKDEALELVQIDATYFVRRLLDAVHRLLPLVAESLHQQMQMNHELRREVAEWAVKQNIAGSPADPEFAQAIARQIIYRLLGKVLFYQSLRRTARHLPKLDLQGVDSSQVLPALRGAFAQALKIDYHAVFEEHLPDRIKWPGAAAKELAGLVQDFNTRDFAHLPQDVVGTVFEQLIPPEERHDLGQFFTPENLCDLIAAFCIRSPDDKVLDPTCGTGTFLIRAYDRLRWLGRHDHAGLLSQLWGVDIAPFPAELAVINLFRQRIAEHANFPRIILLDFLKISPGDCFPFPPPKVDLEHSQEIEEPFPLFDAIIGNFPYVSAERIERVEKGYLDFLRRRLLDGWLADYPQLFRYPKPRDQKRFEELVAAGQQINCDQAGLQLRISTYADLYVYLFFHTARFLKPGGRMGIVTSNAWLDVNFGYELQKFLLNRFKIVAVLESRCEPWFTEAAVNTVVTVLERCDNPEDRDAHLVKFVKVKRPLADLIPGDPVVETVNRWQHLARHAAKIEGAGRKYANVHPLGLVTEEDDDFRIRIRRQRDMRGEVERAGKLVKWGLYLRAPQVYFDILRHGKMCLMRDIATPKFGSKTRINEFFHVTSEVAARFGIEEEYLWPLIKSPKETITITINPDDLKLRLFTCRRSKEELQELGHQGALSYITWGEQQTYNRGEFKGLPWPQGTWLKDRTPGWWSLPESETQLGQIFWNKDRAERHFVLISPLEIIPDCTCYFIKPTDENLSEELFAAILNSTVSYLSIEIIGRVILGDGVLATKVEEANDYLIIPDIRTTTEAQKVHIKEAFKLLCKREIVNIFEEVKRKDRQTLDAAVLEAIGLDPKKYLKPIYEGLCVLVRERLELGKMRSQARKTKARGEKAEKRTGEQVLDELLPNGPERFPEAFFSPAAAHGPKAPVELPDQELQFDLRPIIMEVHTADGSFRHHVNLKDEGKFLIYAQRAGHHTAQLPVERVELTRTVKQYERYLKKLRQDLYQAYYRHTLDQRAATRLTQVAWERFHLPPVDD
jgi:type I restriction enzyme M protein